MKIVSFTCYQVPPRWLFLKITTDEGIEGWGEPVIEGRAATVKAAVEELGAMLVGKDPMRIEDHWQMMYRGGFYRGGPILMSAIAGIDQALWDIKGKALNTPVYQLLGGACRDSHRQQRLDARELRRYVPHDHGRAAWGAARRHDPGLPRPLQRVTDRLRAERPDQGPAAAAGEG